jgi:hypothetical protein
MAFWGVTDDRQGHGVIIETPDDAAIRLVRLEDRLAIAPEWDAQKGQFGYALCRTATIPGEFDRSSLSRMRRVIDRPKLESLA